jgi:hypothetical protein
MLRSRSNSFDDAEEFSKKSRVDDEDPNGPNGSVFTSFSVTCEIVPIEGVSNERAHLRFSVIPRVSSESLSAASSIPDGFRANCLNENSKLPPGPISVELLPHVHSSNNLTMEYVGPIVGESQDVGNLELRKTESYGGMYSDRVDIMNEEFCAYQQTVTDIVDLNTQYKNSYSTMVGHQLIIKLDNVNFERITAIDGLIDLIIANGIFKLYNRIGEVLVYYESQLSTQSVDRKIGWVKSLAQLQVQRSNHPSFPPSGLLEHTINDGMTILIDWFAFHSNGPLYVMGEYIIEEQHMSQKYLPNDLNDLYRISSTSDVQYPFGLHAPSFAWPRTTGSVGGGANN